MRESMRYIPGSTEDPAQDPYKAWNGVLKHSPEMYSRDYRWKLVAEIITGLYDWYKTNSQPTRRWQTLHPEKQRIQDIKSRNPDATIKPEVEKGDHISWGEIRTDHTVHIKDIIDGFRRVEHYAPDYVQSILEMIATMHDGKGLNYGRRLFAMAWGDEEASHARAWTFASVSSGIMTPQEVMEDEVAMHQRGKFIVPPDNVFQMIAYVVVQELATQVSYSNFGKLVKPSEGNKHSDPQLAKLSALIGRDESAHFRFFREVAEVVMAYFPTEMTEAIIHVTNPTEFRMPSKESIPEDKYKRFERAAAGLRILTPHILAKDVFAVSLATLNMSDREDWVQRLAKAREIEHEDESVQTTHQFGIELPDQWIENHIAELNKKTIGKINRLYKDAGVEHIIGLLKDISPLMPTHPKT